MTHDIDTEVKAQAVEEALDPRIAIKRALVEGLHDIAPLYGTVEPAILALKDQVCDA